MKIRWTKKAVKDLKQIQKIERKRILNAIDRIYTGDVKKLKGSLENLWRLRVGNYRVIFEMVEDVLIIRVLHRKNVYDKID